MTARPRVLYEDKFLRVVDDGPWENGRGNTGICLELHVHIAGGDWVLVAYDYHETEDLAAGPLAWAYAQADTLRRDNEIEAARLAKFQAAIDMLDIHRYLTKDTSS